MTKEAADDQLPIKLYYWSTPNGHKVSIMLEEIGLPYEVALVDILAGEQFAPRFLKISPNNKIPAIEDPNGPDGEPIHLFDSVAILQYLADKSGQLGAKNKRHGYEMSQWLLFQAAHIGPMLGQNHHFRIYAPETISYAIERYTTEAMRLYSVLDTRLAQHEYICDDYSIADIAVFPWIVPHKRQGQNLDNFPHIKRWYSAVSQRPAVQRGMSVMRDKKVAAERMDKASWERLFGNKQS